METKLRVLLIEDNEQDVKIVKRMLAESSWYQIDVTAAESFSNGMNLLAHEKVDAILLDLGLPDLSGLEAYDKLRDVYPAVPVLILTGLDDQNTAVQAVKKGAQDYLLKSDLSSPKMLAGSIVHAVERQRFQEELRNLAITDPLTGLYNLRGFHLLTEQQMKLVGRAPKGLILFMFDLDNMKQINDHLGHLKGDLALRQTAEVLRRTFRSSDILARYGGDEFVALAIDANAEEADIIGQRLQKQLAEINLQNEDKCQLSLSIGYSICGIKDNKFVEQLIAEADTKLYESKKRKNSKR